MSSISRWTMGNETALCAAIAIIFGVILAVPIAHAEQPFELTDCWSAKVTMLSKSEDLTVLGSEVLGMTISGNKLFNDLTSYCLCIRCSMDGKQKSTCYSKFMDVDGDFFVTETIRTGMEAGPESSWRFLQGTGKFEGITGGGKSMFTASNLKRPLKSGMLQGRLKMKGTFELRK